MSQVVLNSLSKVYDFPDEDIIHGSLGMNSPLWITGLSMGVVLTDLLAISYDKQPRGIILFCHTDNMVYEGATINPWMSRIHTPESIEISFGVFNKRPRYHEDGDGRHIIADGMSAAWNIAMWWGPNTTGANIVGRAKKLTRIMVFG